MSTATTPIHPETSGRPRAQLDRAGKDELLDRAAALARTGSDPDAPEGSDLEALLRSYVRHVAPEDLTDRSEADVWGAFASHLDLAVDRPEGTARVRVVTPAAADQGWSAGGRSVVEVVVDDMPFLVDSLQMELTRQQRGVHVFVHPAFDVVRDVTGVLHALAPVDKGAAEPVGAARRESWMHVEVDRIAPDEVDAVVADVQRVLRDVREAWEDWPKMRARADDVVADLRSDPPPLPPAEIDEAAALLGWLADDHFTFLGYREYTLVEAADGADALSAVPGTGLGILRADQIESDSFARLPEPVRALARDKTLLVLAKANSRATVHRPSYLDYVGLKTFDDAGQVVGERRFLGLYSSAAYTESLWRVPILRQKARAVLDHSGFDPHSHAGKALLNTLETYPRDELFHTPASELAPVVEAATTARERRALRIFVRRDTYRRYVTVLVYLPRDRYTTTVRERFADILAEQLGGESVEFTVRIDESATARVHFVVHLPRGAEAGSRGDIDAEGLERRLAEAARSWRDDLGAAVMVAHGEERGAVLTRRWAESFPEAYKEDFTAGDAAADVGRLEALGASEPVDPSADKLPEDRLDLDLRDAPDDDPAQARLTVYRVGTPLSLSAVLPVLASHGVEVVDERPYRLEGLARSTGIYDFGLRWNTAPSQRGRDLFTEALHATWSGRNEVDGFNALVLRAELTWRQGSVLRAYARYLRQGGTPFSQGTIETALADAVDITRMLVELFETRFDPDLDDEGRQRRTDELLAGIGAALDDVASLDQDRILRSYRTLVLATLRTNYHQRGPDGGPKDYLALKLDPEQIPELPQPRPRFEIFVCSPRVEGVHLRFGAVARGGLRWSDRRDDFRTEVLGLVKAQLVKNTVIVPVGAKGGFFAKQLPAVDPGRPGDREAWLAEGVASYRTFISGLLDLTDNLVDGQTVPPPRVVRHDGDDSYLVVAADKGTATFSDIANAVAHDYGFWLGDAFASGGSVGYDHKAMGITARGAWVSVRRHFRELGVDCQREDVTCVGIGDMSGDVFGNGMLCSPHLRLIAAFDHRDIFIDPDPDAATSYAERQRMFALPRSSWRDYDTDLISEGGGVWSRSLKSVPVSAPVRAALGLADDVTALAPTELMQAILAAPVDLWWNGGIGTYVKGAQESHAQAGDKANDPIRIDGGQLRARVVGEGGNLGLTQAGRIEYAQAGGPDGLGGAINTDFIDNSAGVDTSDHEVNIKILLDRVVAAGDLDLDGRNQLLAEMTDEVAALVLADNEEQNLALANAAANATSLLHVHEAWMRRLEADGVLDREVEGLPSRSEVARRAERGDALTAPELSVLLAWTKIVLADALIDTDLPDDPYLDDDLRGYFPHAIQERYVGQVEDHPLRREIIVTQVVGDLVDGAGMTFWPRLAGETGADVADLVRANFVAREIFGSLALRREVRALDHAVTADVQTRMRLEMRTLVERASRWLVTHRRPPLDSVATVAAFAGPVQALVEALPDLLAGSEREAFEDRRTALLAADVPESLATRVAVLPPAYALLGVVDTAARDDLDPVVVARVHLALGDRLGLPLLLERIAALPRADRWQTMVRAALRDDLHDVHAQLTHQALAATAADADAASRVGDWEQADAVAVGRAASTLEQVCSDDTADLARLSVGLRVVRGLLAT